MTASTNGTSSWARFLAASWSGAVQGVAVAGAAGAGAAPSAEAARLELVPPPEPAPAAVSVPLPPDAPTGVTAALEAGPQIALNWTDVATNETGYIIERSENGGAFAPLTSLPADAVTYTDTAVVSLASYAYRVAAVNESGASAWADASPASIAVP